MEKRLIVAFDVIDESGQSLLTGEMYPNALDIPMRGDQLTKIDCFNIHMALWSSMSRICHYDDFKHLFPDFNSAELGEEVPNDNPAHRFGRTTFEYSPTRMRFSHHNKGSRIFRADSNQHE